VDDYQGGVLSLNLCLTGVSLPRDRFWDIPVPKIDSPTRQPLGPGRPASVPLRHTIASLSMARSERLTMNNQVYLLIGALLCCTFSCGLAQAQNPACHLHAPTDYTSFSNQPLVIPNVGSLSACEQFNLQRFSARGRCHRSQDQVSIKQRSGPVNYSGVINPPDFLP
jgi:hypothetical protein